MAWVLLPWAPAARKRGLTSDHIFLLAVLGATSFFDGYDGSIKTLEEVVDHYDKGGIANPQLDEEIFALKLTSDEKADLITFLKEGLSSPDYPDIAPPKLP